MDSALPRRQTPALLMNVETDTRQKKSLLGTTLDNRYSISEVLGQGGMSTVYKARHLFLHRDVAIKIMQEHLASNTEGRLRFQREAQAAAQLNHPNIVGVTEFGVSEDGEPYMVMDYLKGQSLADLIKSKGRCEPAMALAIFKQVAAALQHAHDKGILHRDLKPSNVMLVAAHDGSLQCKVVDLGLARFLPQFDKDQKRLTAAGELVGSPFYMSPEQIRDEELDSRSDIYSFGCLMYEALTGVRPFVDTNAISVLSMHLYEPPPPFNFVLQPNRIPPRVETLVMKCLEKNRSNRVQSMRELCLQLEALAEWQDGPARSVPFNPADQRPANQGSSESLAFTGTMEWNAQYTLRLDKPQFARHRIADWLRRIAQPLLKLARPQFQRVLGSFEGKGAEGRRQRVTGTKVLVAALGDNRDAIAAAELDASKYGVYYKNVQQRFSMNAQEFLVLLSTDEFDIVHLHGRFDKRAIFKDSTGFQLRLSDVKRACDYAKVKMLWLASENNLDWVKDNPVLAAPSFHLILTAKRGDKFPKFLSTFLSRVVRGEILTDAFDACLPHARYKGEKIDLSLVAGVAEVSFLP